MDVFSNVVVVLFLASVVVANLFVLAHLMVKPSRTSWPPWLTWLLSGGNILVVVGGVFWLAQLPERTAQLASDRIQKILVPQIQQLQTDIRVINGSVFNNADSLMSRVGNIQGALEYIQPRVIREDFDKRIADLTSQLAQLQQDNGQLRQQLTQLNQELEKLRQENQGLQEQLLRYR